MWKFVLLGEYEFCLFVLYVSWSSVGYIVMFSYDDIIKIYFFFDVGFWKVGVEFIDD